VSQLHASDFARQLKAGRQRDIFSDIQQWCSSRRFGNAPRGLSDQKSRFSGAKQDVFRFLKLAQFRFFARDVPYYAILLLDDIFDRLDTSRVEEIVKLVSSSDFGQIFISDTNRESLDEILWQRIMIIISISGKWRYFACL
jgi:DNA replication and repair protein RecF